MEIGENIIQSLTYWRLRSPGCGHYYKELLKLQPVDINVATISPKTKFIASHGPIKEACHNKENKNAGTTDRSESIRLCTILSCHPEQLRIRLVPISNMTNCQTTVYCIKWQPDELQALMMEGYNSSTWDLTPIMKVTLLVGTQPIALSTHLISS
jgi:hypothetical protein